MHKWRSVIWKDVRDEVREFTHANWEKFERERPPWFTPQFQNGAELDMLPEEARGRAIKARKIQRESDFNLKRGSVDLNSSVAITSSRSECASILPVS